MKKGIGKRFTAIVLAATTVIGASISVTSASSTPFTDVNDDSWYASSVATCYSKSIINGTSATEFTPGADVTRGQFVTMLYNANASTSYGAIVAVDAAAEYETTYGITDAAGYIDYSKKQTLQEVKDTGFSDVPLDAYYAAAVIWANSMGIVTGVGDGKFAPNENITREQMMTMLERFAYISSIDSFYKNYEDYDTTADVTTTIADYAKQFGFDTYKKEIVVDTDVLNNYDDAEDISEYAKEGVSWAIQSNYVQGTYAYHADPKGTTTRAQAACLISRILNDVQLEADIVMAQ